MWRPKDLLKGRRAVVVAVLLLAAVAVIVPTLILAQGAPPGPPTDIPMPRPPEVVDREAMARAETELRKGLTDRVQIDEHNTLVAVAGPGTRGKTIKVAGRDIKLPDDAELGGLSLIYEGTLETMPPGFQPIAYPAWVIMRGDVRIFCPLWTGSLTSGEEPRRTSSS